MNKKIRTLALLPILSVLLTACTLQDLPVIGQYFSGSGGSGSDPVTLNVWGLWEDPAVMQTLIDKYQEQNPNVTVNYEDRSIMPLPDYKERVFSRFQDEAAEIDIALVHNSWVSRLSPILSSMPSDVIDVATYEQNYYPVITRSAVVNNEIKAIPAYYDGLVLVYNKEHFEEINQTLPPTAWEEFRRLALELTIRGGQGGNELIRGGAAIGTADNINHFSDILGLMWAQADVGVTEDLRDRAHYNTLEFYNSFVSELDTRPAYDALTFYTNFVLEDGVWSNTMPEASAAFAQGKASMIFIPSWQILDIVSAVPNPNSVGVAPVPQAIQQDARTWATFWMYTVPSNSQKAVAAWNFLNYLAQEEQQLMYFDEASKVRFYGAPYALTSLADEVTNPLITPVLEGAPNARSWEVAGRAGNVTQVNALRDAVNAVLSGESSDEALQVVKETLSN